MSEMLLRILLATYLAIWSPVLCCCSVKSAIGAVTGAEVAGCGERTAFEFENSTSDVTSGCCARRVQTVERVEVSYSEQPRQDEPGSPCRCHEVLESKVRLDTGAKISAPVLVHVQTLPAAATLASFVTDALPAWSSIRPSCHGWPGRDGMSLARMTLHAQRTLLLI